MSDDFDMRVAMRRLTVGQLATYLRSKGWEQVPCRWEDRVLFLGEVHSAGQRYELSLPTGPEVAKYRTLLQRAIYKLCGVEDREPRDIFYDLHVMLKSGEIQQDAQLGAKQGGQRVRLRNSASTPLRLQITSRGGDLELLPGEAIEVSLDTSPDDLTEFDVSSSSLVIRDRPT